MRKLLLNVAFSVASFTSIAQVGIGTTTPDASAALEIESTTKGFLLPRMTLVQINAIAAPVEGLMVYCLDCTTKGVFVNNGSDFLNITNGENMNPGAIDTTTAVVDITGPGGGVWMDRNLGATQVAASSTDTASYGDFYQWGRAKDGHESRNSAATSAATPTTGNTVTSADAGHGDFILAGSGTNNNWTDFAGEATLWQSGLNDPCPAGYRIPTVIELNDELGQFSTNDADGAFSALKLPLGGNRSYSGNNFNNVGSEGRYWSSTVSADNVNTQNLHFWGGNAQISNNERAYGFSVRCIKE
jgi:hypothetical protein